MRGLGRTAARLGVVLCVAATLLAPAWANPTRTISVPVTLARTARLGPGVGSALTFEFRPTHLGWSWTGDEGTKVQFRTTDVAGHRSGWTTAHENHDAERGDEHFSGVLAVDRPTAVTWRAVVPPRHEMGPVTLDYINTLDGPRRDVTMPAIAQAVASDPQIVTRAEWGADESLKSTSGGCERRHFPVQQLFVHHTVGANFDDNPKAAMRAIYWYHVVRQGWCDVGYNFVISWDGRLFEGRWARSYAPWELHNSETRDGRATAGAHVADFNSGSVGVSLMGNFMSIAPPPAMRRTLAEFLAWEADRHDLAPRARHRYRNPETGLKKRLPSIAGHRDAGQTACPGDYLYRALSAVRSDVVSVMGAGKESSSISLTATTAKISYGEAATFTGLLNDESGVGLGERTVRIYQREGSGAWAEGSSITTAPDGSFSLSLVPEANVTVAAVYDGDATLWGAQSENARVTVRPLVSLRAEGATLDLAGTWHYPPGTTSVQLAGDVAPEHHGRPVMLRVSKMQLDGTFVELARGEPILTRDSTYVYTYAVPAEDPSGTYRAVTWFHSDGDHASARSAQLTFIIDP